MLELVQLFLNTEAILSLLFVVVVIGLGFWFYRVGWPFISEYLLQAQRFSYELKLQELKAEYDSDRRWQDILSEVIKQQKMLTGAGN
jgi:hypothetical protein